MLILESVSCTRGGRNIFNKLGVCIESGSIVVLRGKNGSGKTSLLKIITGSLAASTGKVQLYDIDAREDNKALYKELFIYIGHKCAIKGELSVKENIHFWASIRNNEKYIDAGLTFFDLNKIAHLSCYKLSNGWQKKVALARLLCCDSPLWLLDEPFVNLDKIGRESLTNLIMVKAANGGIVVLSSHEKLDFLNCIEINMEDFNIKDS